MGGAEITITESANSEYPMAPGVAAFLLSMSACDFGPGTVSVMIFGKSVLSNKKGQQHTARYAIVPHRQLEN